MEILYQFIKNWWKLCHFLSHQSKRIPIQWTIRQIRITFLSSKWCISFSWRCTLNSRGLTMELRKTWRDIKLKSHQEFPLRILRYQLPCLLANLIHVQLKRTLMMSKKFYQMLQFMKFCQILIIRALQTWKTWLISNKPLNFYPQNVHSDYSNY